jgi:hypothetical protein
VQRLELWEGVVFVRNLTEGLGMAEGRAGAWRDG